MATHVQPRAQDMIVISRHLGLRRHRGIKNSLGAGVTLSSCCFFQNEKSWFESPICFAQNDENRHELNCSPWNSGQQAQSGLPGITRVGTPESRQDLTATQVNTHCQSVQSRPRHDTAVSVTWRGLRSTEVSTACSFRLPLLNTSSHERRRQK